MTETVVGIDLGTTNSVVAHLDHQGRPWTVTSAEGDLTTPSAVFFDSSGAIVGKEAVKAAEFEPGRAAAFAKRNMGEDAYERPICGRPVPPEVIQALILRKVKQDAELRLGPVQKAVITVPAYFNEPRRKSTVDAGLLAGLDVLDIINEPTAAALAFGLQQGFLSPAGQSQQKETILVYDLGGGTFDVTLMEIEGQAYRAVATAGDVRLGGLDWDERIVDYVAEKFRVKIGQDPRDDEQARQSLLREAADAKHALSARQETTIQFSHQGHRLRTVFSRDEFESRTGDLLDRTRLTVRKVLRESERDWSDLTRLLLVGGATRMPMVRQMLEEESGLTADRSLAPDEAVAHGAAIYAGLLAGSESLAARGMSVANVNSHDLGVLGIEPETGRPRRKVLIPRNTTLPALRTAKFVTHEQGQPNVRVRVIEGGDITGEHATHIGKCVVYDLPPNLPAKTPVEVTFNYSASGRLLVAASLPLAQRDAQITIQRFSGLSEQRIDQWREKIQSGCILAEDTEEPSQQPADGPQRDESEDVDTSGHEAGPAAETASDDQSTQEPFDVEALPQSVGELSSVSLKRLSELEVEDEGDKPVSDDDADLRQFFHRLKD